MVSVACVTKGGKGKRGKGEKGSTFKQVSIPSGIVWLNPFDTHFSPNINSFKHPSPLRIPLKMPSASKETSGDPSKLSASLTRRLFLPIVLLQSLLKVFKKEKSIRVLDDPEAVPRDNYETFVNKLGHICDSAKGGDKVTSFAILQLGVIQYYFTSNHRDEEDYERTSDYITDILTTLGSATEDEVARRPPNGTPSAVFQSLLRKILRFNQSRIKGYIFTLKKALEFCINFASDDSSEDGEHGPPTPSPPGADNDDPYSAPVILENLQRLQTLLQFADEASARECRSQNTCRQLQVRC